jgi:hypothetical protein
MNKIIISQPWGGLGDNLQFSTLPELFHNKGYDVYISINNKVRNQEIFDLVWGLNPYIKGISDDDNGLIVGSNMQNRWPKAEENHYFMNRIEIAHGHAPINLYPKIYYTPNNFINYSKYTIIDITGESQAFEQKFLYLQNYINNFIVTNNINYDNIRIIGFKNINKNDNINYFPEYKILYIENIYEYCDIINSCENYLTSNSGAHSLASAIKQTNKTPNIFCWNHWENWPECFEKGYYHYPNVKYITMSGLPQIGHGTLPILEAGTLPPLTITPISS